MKNKKSYTYFVSSLWLNLEQANLCFIKICWWNWMKPKLGWYLYFLGFYLNSRALCFLAILLTLTTENRSFFLQIKPFLTRCWFTQLIWQRNEPQLSSTLAIEGLEQIRPKFIWKRRCFQKKIIFLHCKICIWVRFL